MINDKEIKISFHKHRSAKSLLYSYYSLSKKSSLDTQVYLKQFTDKNEFGPVEDTINIIKERRYWAFCRKLKDQNKSSEIHFWVDSSCTLLEILHLFSHELTHSTGIKSESIANRTAAISSFALYVISLHFKNKIKLEKGNKNAIHKTR